MGLIQKAFSDIITFSRSSNATRIGPTGRVQYAPHNLFTYSEEFSNAAWAKTACTVTTNAIASPNGTVTADLIQLGAGTTSKNLVATVTTTSPCTMTVYAKAGSHSVLQLLNSGTANHFCNFDLNAGAIGNSGSGTTGSIVYAGNGWYRCTATFNSTIGTGFWIVAADATGNGYNATTSSTGTYYIWGAQLSVGSVPGDYTPTTSAAVYGPRFDFDPVTLAARGLLIEEQRTNLVLRSEEFDNASWSKGSGVSITANADTAPDGTTSAERYEQTSGTVSFFELYQSISSAAGAGTYTYSLYAKDVSGTYLNLSVYSASTSYAAAIFNLSTGAVANSQASTYTGLSASITSAGNGWYRCSITFTKGSTTNPDVDIVIPNSTTIGVYGLTGSFTGSGKRILLWGAQLEAGAFATSYIPTVASTVTRSADVASVNTLSPWFNASAGTLFAEFDFIGFQPASPGVNQGVASFTDGTAGSNNLAIFGYGTSGFGARTALTFSASSLVAFLQGSNSQINTSYKSAFAFAANDYRLVNNGGTVLSDTSGSLPSSINQLILGNLYTTASATYQNGHLRRLAYYPRALSTAELQALTA